MKKLKSILLALLAPFCMPDDLFGQENHFSGWGALIHTQRFSEHWGASFDAQFRSANKYDYLRNILLRPSVNYYFDNNKVAALGYAYNATNGRDADGEHTFRPESRIWEQLIVNQKLDKATILQHRFRLEQRFVGNTTLRNDQHFSQRLRYFARAVIPFRHDTVFTKGPFIGLQNEVFFNVQNKNKVNGSLFDQNRAYMAIGYRLSKKMDVEVGYLNQYTKHRESYTINNIAQLALYTRF
jgi:hypothetical protein